MSKLYIVNNMRFIDLFAGIGWIKIWLQNAGFTCVLSNDVDKNCKITFDSNFKNQMYLKDLTQVDADEFPDFEILAWGFPCQPFSIAWYRKWFADEWRWNLFFDITRILKARKPKAILLENVKNLKTHNNWESLTIIYNYLNQLWYHVKDTVLNTAEYWNIPQNRERIYIVWFLEKQHYDNFEFPKAIELTTTIHDCFEKEVDHKYYYNDKPLYERIKDDITSFDTIYQWRRKYVRENKKWLCPTLTANMWTWWHNVPIIKDHKGIRKITPRECANFQWFPKNYILPNIADSHLYKQFWNSVSIPVIERIGKRMRLAIQANTDNVLNISKSIWTEKLSRTAQSSLKSF